MVYRYNDYMKHMGTLIAISRLRLAYKQQSGICTLGKLTRIGALPPSVQRAVRGSVYLSFFTGSSDCDRTWIAAPSDVWRVQESRGAAERRGRTAEKKVHSVRATRM